MSLAAGDSKLHFVYLTVLWLFACVLQESERDYLGAIALYLKGGMPGKAAAVVMNGAAGHVDEALVGSILAALAKADLHEVGRSFCVKTTWSMPSFFEKALKVAVKSLLINSTYAETGTICPTCSCVQQN